MRAPLLFLLCLAFVAANSIALGQDPAATLSALPCPTLSAGPTRRTVVRVIDAETVVLDDARELRLIGALPPRAIDVGAEPGAWTLETSAKEALEPLVLGKSVELVFGGDRADRYGRVLAHALVIDGSERRWVQGHMLEQGYARAYTLPGNRACAAELLARERVAREAGRGLWAEAAYQVRRAAQASELHRYRATFQAVEGRVTRAALVRNTIYLSFSRRWRRGFSAFLRSSDKEQLGAFASNPQALAGRWVRVRGWIEGGDRLHMDLSAGGAFEILDGSGPFDRQSR